MQLPFDASAKALIDAALVGLCEVTLHAATTPDTMYIDAVVMPKASTADLLSRGLLGRLALEPCAIEAFVATPSRLDFDHCAARALFAGVKKKRPLRLWVISPGEPRTAIDAWGLTRRRGWPSGVYLGPIASVVVLSQLSRRRETLLLRLMGSGALLRNAVRDARALPAAAWERPVIDNLLLQMQRDLDRMMRTSTANTEELQMRYAELVKINEAERAKMRAEATAEGRAEGRAEGLRAAINDLCELLAIKITAEQRGAIDRLSAEQLDALRLTLKRERRWPL